MKIIYKSCSPKYTSYDIERLSGVVTFVSFERLLRMSLYDAIGKKENEKMMGMKITEDGIQVYIEKEN